LGSESETCVGSCVHLVGGSISFEKNFYRLPSLPPLWFAVSVLQRFSRPGLPHVPLMQDPLASLEASLAAPPRKPRNASPKRVSKKLKVTETTSPEVSLPE
jgi:hypothetical protein